MSGMKAEHEAHLEHIKSAAAEAIDRKYRQGQDKHGGCLWKLPSARLIEEAINEALDQVVYLLTLRDQLGLGCSIGRRYRAGHDCGADEPCRACREAEEERK